MLASGSGLLLVCNIDRDIGSIEHVFADHMDAETADLLLLPEANAQ